MCRRCDHDTDRFKHLHQSKTDTQFHVFRKWDDPELNQNKRNGNGQPPRPGRPPRPKKTTAPKDWQPEVWQLVADLSEEWKVKLAEALGLPRCSLDALPQLGFIQHQRLGACWTFPEVNGVGQVVGYVLRNEGGEKRAAYRSNRGLTVPVGWQDRDGDVFIVEGPSDVLAMTAMGLAAVGRPSALAGVEDLNQLLAQLPAIAGVEVLDLAGASGPETGAENPIKRNGTSGNGSAEKGTGNGQAAASQRRIVVMGEYDPKPDGSWPGLAGCKHVAAQLQAPPGWQVCWALPPDRAKDVRAWFLAQQPPLDLADALDQLGQRFTTRLCWQPSEGGCQTPSNTGLALTTAEDEPDEVVGWMVPGRIPKARLCLLSGDGGKGKSQILCHVAAMVTQGKCWFGLSYPEPTDGEVIMAIGEDGLGDTAKARLRSAGANRKRIHFVKPRKDNKGNPIPFDLTQLPELRATLKAHPAVQLVTIDPIAAYLGGSAGDGNNDPKLRSVLDPLQDLAIETGVTILVSGHFNKSIAATVKQRVSGSVAFRNVPRSLIVCLDDSKAEEGFLLCWDKLSYAPEPDSLRYGIVLAAAEELPRLQAGLEHWTAEKRAAHAGQLTRIEWRGEDSRKGNAVARKEAAEAQQAPGEVAQLAAVLRDFLTPWPRLGTDCIAKLKEACGTDRSERWLRETVLIDELEGHTEKEKTDRPRSIWCLPDQTCTDFRLA